MPIHPQRQRSAEIATPGTWPGYRHTLWRRRWLPGTSTACAAGIFPTGEVEACPAVAEAAAKLTPLTNQARCVKFSPFVCRIPRAVAAVCVPRGYNRPGARLKAAAGAQAYVSYRIRQATHAALIKSNFGAELRAFDVLERGWPAAHPQPPEESGPALCIQHSTCATPARQIALYC